MKLVHSLSLGGVSKSNYSDLLWITPVHLLLDEVYRKKRLRQPRQEVARQLKNYDTESSVDALIILLQDKDVYVRIPAVDSLKELNRPRLREVWEKAMDDESYYVTEIAREALAHLNSFVSTKPI